MSKDVKISVDDDSRSVLDESLKEEILKIYDNLGPSSELKQIKINEIENRQISFFVPSYQRGYRWSKDEIITLLNDIKSVYDKKKTEDDCMYCMHPLVIRNSDKSTSQDKTTIDKWLPMNAEGDIYNILFAGDISEARQTLKSRFKPCEDSDCNRGSKVAGEYYELVDGQQRLTSVYIILWVCNLLCDGISSPNYSMFYELERGIDATFVKDAVKYTIEWFENCNSNDCKEFVVEEGKKNKEKKSYILENIKKFAEVIRENLFFIWYLPIDDSNNETGEGLFRKINKGRIELTNAELFKAMLLNCPRVAGNKKEMNMIAYEWDKMEQDLHDDDFWCFICNDSFSGKTRIDYILEIYALYLVKNNDELGKDLDSKKDRYSFYVVSRYISNVQNGIEINTAWIDYKSSEVYVWEQIKEIYDKLYTWYQDIELYHNIGFLVAVSGNCSEFIQTLYNKSSGLSLSGTRNLVKKQIYDKLIGVFKDENNRPRRGRPPRNPTRTIRTIDFFCYDGQDKKIKDLTRYFLLYSNIFPYINENNINANKRGLKFPFRLYYGLNENGGKTKWDIEHIRPQSDAVKSAADTVDKLVNLFVKPCMNSEHEEYLSKEEYKKLIKEYVGEDSDFGKFDEIIDYIDKKRSIGTDAGNPGGSYTVDDLKEEIFNLCGIDPDSDNMSASDELKIDEIDKIGNLVLLDKTTNTSYHDDLFLVKRKKIIEKDKNSAFILPTTRNVFLNYFSKNSGGGYVWRNTDAEDYKNELEHIIDEISKWGDKK